MSNSVLKSGARSGAIAGVAVALAFIGAAPASAAGAQLTVTPTTGIADGQSITVTGTGFTAGATVFVVECVNSATAHSCDITGGAQTTTADAGGAISVSLPVHKTFAGADPATGQPTGNVDCATAPGCAVRAATDRSTSAAEPVPISFS